MIPIMKRFIITTTAFIMLMITDGYSQTEKSSGNLTFKISGFLKTPVR
jgi:hypothetical protein